MTRSLPTDRALSEAEAHAFIEAIVKGELDAETAKVILLSIQKRGESIEEITGMAKAMRAQVTPINAELPLLDTCGTGGSGLPRINTSTLSAFVLAAGDVRVAKHGNRAASGRCGSFDVLDAVGINIDLNQTGVESILENTNLGFIYAKNFHPVMKNIMPIRQSIPGRTIFNLLGPLLNPAQADHHILGTSNKETAEKLIQVLQNLNLKRALVVVGQDGLDEITRTTDTDFYELNNGTIQSGTIAINEFELKPVPFEAIQGGDQTTNAQLFMDILNNEATDPYQELVALNAGAGFYLAQNSSSILEGYQKALALLSKGKALEKFNEYRSFSSKQS
jgi:anthranilate phosphoribosyltransferase